MLGLCEITLNKNQSAIESRQPTCVFAKHDCANNLHAVKFNEE